MKLIEQWRNGTLADTQRLKTLRVFATTEPKCNLACEHCYWPHDLERANAQDWSSPVSYLKSLGVPLFFVGRILNERGAEFLRMVIKERATSYMGIVDNGLTILNYPEFLSHWQSINISIDGWREHHDTQRNRKGLFDMAWKTALTLKEQELEPIISSAISPITMNEWEKFEELLMHHDIPMSSTPVWNLPETAKRGRAVFPSDERLRQSFMKLVNGMSKLINIYSAEYVTILKDILAQYEWIIDEEDGDCLKTVLPSRTIIIYRPVSLVSMAELALHWDGVFYSPPTYGPECPKDDVDEKFFSKLRKQNEKELAVWSEITPLIQKKGGERVCQE